MKKEVEEVLVTHIDGKLTREGAVLEARKLYGEDGTISSDDNLPRLVWEIGNFYQTIGRGPTWEKAIERSVARAAKNRHKRVK